MATVAVRRTYIRNHGSTERHFITDDHQALRKSATRAVIDSFANCGDERHTVLAGVVRRLHGFIREIEPTQHEWDRGIEFVTEAGRLSDGRRQELILLSDVLGASMLVDAVNNRKTPGATESTVLGPFHVGGSPA